MWQSLSGVQEIFFCTVSHIKESSLTDILSVSAIALTVNDLNL